MRGSTVVAPLPRTTGPVAGPTIAALLSSYRDGTTTPSHVVDTVLSQIGERGEDGTWISVAGPGQLFDRAAELEADASHQSLPLYGIPFALKDSIDVAGWETTLACPDYAYRATQTAPSVQRLLDAGAILIGKTNLDQFATGLNGTRTP
jgi:allophanate hydrolase